MHTNKPSVLCLELIVKRRRDDKLTEEDRRDVVMAIMFNPKIWRNEIGFNPIGEFTQKIEGPDVLLYSASNERGVYAFLIDEQVKYVGETERAS